MNEPLWFTPGPYHVQSVFAPNKKAWKKLMKRLGVTDEAYPTADARVTTFYETPDGTVCVLTVGDHLEDDRNKLAVATLIAHEVQHIWQRIKKDMREKKPGKEYEAYTVQWLLREALELFEQSRYKLFKD